MNKTDALAAIRRAKSAHIKWRAFAQAMIAGVPMTNEKLPKLHTECEFGKWYYGDGNRLLGNLDSFRGVEGPHEVLHAIYQRIFNLLRDGEGETLLDRLIKSKASRERRRTEQARELMVELIAVSETLLKSIEILEEEIHGMG